MRTYQGIVRDNKVILPEDAHLREGSTVSVIVLDEAIDHEADEATRESLVRQDLLAAGLVLDPHPAARPPARERRLIDVQGNPLSQVVIDERG
jgi:hypothetical protein